MTMPNLGNFGLGLPALLGVALGIWAYTGGTCWLVGCAVGLGVTVALLKVGERWMASNPVGGAWVVELGIFAPILMTALVTALIIWLTVLGLPLLFGKGIEEETKKTLSATLLGAVTTYTAFVWTKDIADGSGPLWPSAHFKAGLKAFQTALPADKRAKQDSIASQALFNERVDKVTPPIVGWDFNARRARLAIVKALS